MALTAAALSETRAAFDAVAAVYGDQNEANPILAAMRARTIATIRSHVPMGGHLLDLGSGPGTDALTLARWGYRVTGIDASPAMVEAARHGIARAGLGDRVCVRRLGIHELQHLPLEPLDGAYSDFGPLNCVPDLAAVARQLAIRLRPGAPLIASVIGRICPWEIAVYAARRDWARIRVRFADEFVSVPLEGQTVWTRYYSPRTFAAIFEQAGFFQVSLRGLGVLAPPPYLDHVARRHPVAVARLQALEDQVAAWPGVRSIGDHFLIVLKKQ